MTNAPVVDTTPVRIHADRAVGTLAIEWGDGHQTVYPAVALRWLCPCAFCRGEAGQPGWLDSRPELTAEQTRLVDLHLVGQSALAPVWGDDHRTGYYTFALLRERCPCDADTGRRVREDENAPPLAGDHEGHAAQPSSEGSHP